MPKKILLISSSTVYGRGYLDHVEAEIRGFLGCVKEVLFIPFAQHDLNAYDATAQKRFQKIGYPLKSIHHYGDMPEAAAATEAIFIGARTTRRFLSCLYSTL